MFASYFTDSNYIESLRYVSLIIDFFQRNPIFDHTNTPGLPINVPRLHSEIYNLKSYLFIKRYLNLFLAYSVPNKGSKRKTKNQKCI